MALHVGEQEVEVVFGGGPHLVFDTLNGGAVVEPDLSMPDLSKKSQTLQIFRELTTKLPRVVPVTVENTSDGATKKRSDLQEGVHFGPEADLKNIRDFFMWRTMETKIQDLLTYIEMLATLNESNWVLGNHDPSLVYYPFHRKSGIAIVGTDEMQQVEKTDLAWQREVNSEGLIRTLSAFLTKSTKVDFISDQEVAETIPNHLAEVINNPGQYTSARELYMAVRNAIIPSELVDAEEASKRIGIYFSNFDRSKKYY